MVKCVRWNSIQLRGYIADANTQIWPALRLRYGGMVWRTDLLWILSYTNWRHIVHTIDSTGTSWGCAINRSSIYILLGILVRSLSAPFFSNPPYIQHLPFVDFFLAQINLAALCFDLFCSLGAPSGNSKLRKKILKNVGFWLPIALVCLAYSFDNAGGAESENNVLNIARWIISRENLSPNACLCHTSQTY